VGKGAPEAGSTEYGAERKSTRWTRAETVKNPEAVVLIPLSCSNPHKFVVNG